MLNTPLFIKLTLLAIKVIKRKTLKTLQLLQTIHIYKQYYIKHYSEGGCVL
jgi:hypothetical protein